MDVVSGPSLFRSVPALALRRARQSCRPSTARASTPPWIAIRHAASDEEYRAGVAAFQQAIVDDPPAIFLAWGERARAVSRRFEVPGRKTGATRWRRSACGGRPPTYGGEPKLGAMATRNPPHRDRFALLAGAGRRRSAHCLRRRVDPLAAARHPPVGRAGNRTSPPAPPRKSAATSPTNAELLKALAANLQDTGLTPTQQDRIIKNYVLEIREFREITLFDEAGASLATSRIGKPRVEVPNERAAAHRWRVDVGHPRRRGSAADDGVRHPPDGLGAPAGWLVGAVQPRRNVADRRSHPDRRARVRAGRSRPNGELVAHGDPDRKALVAQATNMSGHPLMAALRADGGTDPSRSNTPTTATASSASRRAMAPLGWTMIVEQPTSEAVRQRHGAAAAARRRDLGRRCC